MAAKPITIVGGGLAGLTLGIGLRLCNVPVTVWEAGHYPRHRVCGEFISGRGQEMLSRLGLRELLEHAGAVNAGTAAFFSATRSTPPRSLPAHAICLSRFTMDHALAFEFHRLGGELLEGQRRHDEDFGEGMVRATGRRAQPGKGDSRWFGLKVHARKVPLTADLEMHVSPRGYVGLCRVDGGVINVCGLFRRRAGADPAPQNWREWLRGQAGSPLNLRLTTAEFDESSFCAVAGISLRAHRAATRAECCIGDAITMIPPVTGNGMSLAFESAELALEPLAAWSRGEQDWERTRRQVAEACDIAFAQRLAWARWLQWLMLTPLLRTPAGRLALHSAWLWRTLFARTR